MYNWLHPETEEHATKLEDSATTTPYVVTTATAANAKVELYEVIHGLLDPPSRGSAPGRRTPNGRRVDTVIPTE